MNRTSGQFFAGARFAGDEHRRVGHAAFVDTPVKLLHRLALADHAVPAERRLRHDRGLAQARQPMRVTEREHEPFVQPRAGHEIEAVIENETADQFVFRLARRDLRDPVGFDAPHARGQRGQMLRRAVVGEFDEADLDIAALDHALGDRRAFRVHGLPARRPPESGEFLVGRVRHVKNGSFRVDRRASRIHVTPGFDAALRTAVRCTRQTGRQRRRSANQGRARSVCTDAGQRGVPLSTMFELSPRVPRRKAAHSRWQKCGGMERRREARLATHRTDSEERS